MHKLFKLLKRFAYPYKKYIFLNITFHALSTIFTLFSFASIIPILQILFGINTDAVLHVDWTWNDSFTHIASALKNNVFYYIGQIILFKGAGFTLFLLGVFLIVMTFFKTGTSFLGSFFMIPIRTGVLRDLRNQLYKKILSLPIGFFSEERKGDIMSRMTSDVNEVEVSIMSSLDTIFKNPIMIIVYLATMLVMSWQLTFFVLVLLPVCGYFIGKIGSSLKKKSTEGQEQTGELLSQIEETLGGLRIVKAFNAEKKINQRFSLLNEKIRKTFNRINRRHALAHPMSEFLGTVVIAIVLWYGGSLILNNNSSISAPSFIYYLVIFYSVINPAKELSRASYSIQKGLASLERIDRILDAKESIVETFCPERLNFDFEDKIEYKNVSFRYAEKWVLKNINLTIEKGKTIAFVGQSGSGKSTLVDLLPRFYDVEKGELTIDGVNVKNLRLKDIRNLMGNVNQEAILFNDTFFNNISFGVENATMEDVIAAAKTANAHDFIMATENGYETTIGDRGSKLSGGQRQRLSIARAILKNPPILILDEATSALDTESEKLVQEALENLMKNRTTLVVAHRLSTIQKADEICVLYEGEIVERGKHQDLLNQDGYYKRLCDMQSF
ncbi:MAG: ABC transporter ATP-binding protein [Paludibacteraceae bacterium]|nr:ABC transporter ATP-binding protein [Paludibacteraceae bacterium]